MWENALKRREQIHAINSPALREMARKAWGMMASEDVEIRWISRKENPAGRMLGS